MAAQVGDDHRGVRRSLHVNHFRVRLDCLLDLLQAGGIHVTEFQAELDQQLRGEAEDAAIDGLRKNGVVARAEQTKHGINGGHAGSEDVSGVAAFEFRDACARAPLRFGWLVRA